MKHIVITGGAGFIGSALSRRFLKDGYAVTAVDNLLTSTYSNLESLLPNERFSFVKQNVSECLEASQMAFIKKYGLDGVLHFACPASPIDFSRIPFDILEVDSIGTKNTVALARRLNARYLLASTSEIYGDPLEHPQKEEYRGNVSTMGPRACYDEAKRFAEAYVSTAHRPPVNLNSAVIRIFNTYGPGMRENDGRVIPDFCSRALSKKALRIHGDGKQTRSFCYIDDLVEGIVRLFHSDCQDVVNLGSAEEWKIDEVAKMLQEISEDLTGFRPEIIHTPAREDDPRKRRPDLSRAMEYLGWRPKVSLKDGLRETFIWFMDHHRRTEERQYA